MENLNSTDHFKILREAAEQSCEADINFICGDGFYVVNSAVFKYASSFWIKLLGTVPESNPYIMIAPDISVQSLYHIGNDNDKDKRYVMVLILYNPSQYCQ